MNKDTSLTVGNIPSRMVETSNNLSQPKKIYKTYKNQPLIIGNSYKVRDKWYIYMGDFASKDLVPNISCCFTIGDGFYIKYASVDMTKPVVPSIQRRKRVDDNIKIEAPIKDSDNTLMVFVKTLIDKKNITRGQFKEFYSNVSDMNNVLRCIVSDENLSWARFTDLCDKMDVQFDMTLRDKNGDILVKT